MRVELVAVGTELLLGDIVNTNAAWLGQQLAAAGLDVHGSTVVGDNQARIGTAVHAALDRAEAVIITGGLGPTQDDLTREALAAYAGVELVRDPELERGLRERYDALRRRVPEANFRQADLPVGATPLPNARGTAPGLRLAGLAPSGAGVAYALPGVPHEMTAMFTDCVLPDLRQRAGEPAAIVSRTLRTAGMWESAVAEALAGLVESLDASGAATIAFLASRGQVKVRITAKAASRGEAEELIAPVEAEARRLLGHSVYGADGDTLPGVVHRLLRAQGATVAVAESLTGGGLGAMLSETPGASTTYRGAIVAYATELKSSLLDVPAELLSERGPVDAEVAIAMAQGARTRLGATFGVALTGVAGPDGADRVAPGTVFVGLSGPASRRSHELRLPGQREQVRLLAAVSALDALRRQLGEAAE
ncbi:MAG: competence/damage-inducible protein A [Frankiaceae bacterium]